MDLLCSSQIRHIGILRISAQPHYYVKYTIKHFMLLLVFKFENALSNSLPTLFA